MARCEYCKNEIPKGSHCPYCGKMLIYMAEAKFVSGATFSESAICEVTLTDKYILLRKVSMAEHIRSGTNAQLGLTGFLVNNTVDRIKKKSHGYYDLREIQKVVYPCKTTSLNKDNVFRVVNKDGTDFAIACDSSGFLGPKKTAKKIADFFRSFNIPVEDGSNAPQPTFSMHPFVDKETFGRRVCGSAASFVQLTDEQFVSGYISEFPKQNYVQQHRPFAGRPQFVFCTACGNKVSWDSNFCDECGNRIIR